MTTVSTGPGFWATWQPFSLPQCWPFAWWVGVIMDHYSRRIMGMTLFQREPTSEAVRAFLGRVIHTAGAIAIARTWRSAAERRMRSTIPYVR